MNVLIAGYGDIGARLGSQLQRDGHRVYALRRRADRIVAPVTAIGADLSRPLSASLLPDAIDQVIYILSAGGFSEQAYQQAYVDGVRHLVDALGDRVINLQRFIFVSSTSVYAQNAGEWVDEDAATVPRAFNGQIMLEAEKQVLALPAPLVVRFSGIYGAGRNRMLNQVKTGRLAAPTPVIYSNRIHSEDCVAVLYHLCMLEQPGHRVILASDHQPAALHDIQCWLADRLGVPANQRRYEVPVRRAGSKRICNRRLLDTGYRFIHPDYRAGYGKLLS